MGVLEAVFLIVFWAWAATAALFLRQTFLPPLPLLGSPDTYGLSADTIRFQSTDGVPLQAWRIRGQTDRPWLILCHGAGANRGDLLDIALRLHEAGFNQVLLDFRGHGGSAGRTTSFGYLEQRDLEGVLAWLGRDPDVPDRPYGVYGVSMGGAVALAAAAYDERLGAVAVEAPYASLDQSLGRHLALMYPWLPREPVLSFIKATYRLRFGVWPGRISPQAAAARLGSRALLVIAGGGDARMPPETVRAIAMAASGPHEFWLVDQAGHLESFAMDPEGYARRVIRFFNSHLT